MLGVVGGIKQLKDECVMDSEILLDNTKPIRVIYNTGYYLKKLMSCIALKDTYNDIIKGLNLKGLKSFSCLKCLFAESWFDPFPFLMRFKALYKYHGVSNIPNLLVTK
jgi:hypothetical protein